MKAHSSSPKVRPLRPAPSPVDYAMALGQMRQAGTLGTPQAPASPPVPESPDVPASAIVRRPASV